MQSLFCAPMALPGQVKAMKLMVMDGQGGGIGATVIKGLRHSIGAGLEILALGSNSIAASRMMKAGANRGGKGEKAIVCTSRVADLIIGPLGSLMANAMMGEVTSEMAAAVSSSRAKKILIPLTQEKIKIVGVSDEPLPHLVNQVIKMVKEMIEDV